MDQTKLQQQIALYYSKLPPSAQKVFSSMEWMDTLSEISKKYELSTEQTETLATETTLVMLGIVSTSEYEKTLEREIRMPAQSITKMIADIDTLVLRTIRPELDTAYENNADDLLEEKYGGTVKLDERFSKLPKEVQVAISESNYQPTLYAIAESHKLSISSMGALEEATTKVMLGIIHPDMYEKELQDKIKISKEEISKLVSEVNEKILKNIREILKSHWGQNNTAKAEDDDVPIPPYAISTITTQAPFKKETAAEVYKDSGIELVKDDKPSTPKIEEGAMSLKEDAILKSSGVGMTKEAPIFASENIVGDTATEKKLLDGIENPVNVATSIIGDKLSGVTKSTNTTTDYSLPKVSKPTEQASPTKPHDPYHEEI